MTPLYFCALCAGLIIINVVLFMLIYFLMDETIHLDDALYYSVQIQTTIGAVDTSKERSIKNMVTIQSIVAFTLNAFLIIFLTMGISRLYKSRYESH